MLFSTSLLERPAERRVHLLRYPSACKGEEFRTHMTDTIAMLKAEERPFAVIHDCRWVRYSQLDLGLPFIEWGKAVSALGHIQRVAFVVDGARTGKWGLAAINAALHLSPVQPARIFGSPDEAERWSTSLSETTASARQRGEST